MPVSPHRRSSAAGTGTQNGTGVSADHAGEHVAEVDGPPPTNASPQLSLFTPSGQTTDESYRESQVVHGRPLQAPSLPVEIR